MTLLSKEMATRLYEGGEDVDFLRLWLLRNPEHKNDKELPRKNTFITMYRSAYDLETIAH